MRVALLTVCAALSMGAAGQGEEIRPVRVRVQGAGKWALSDALTRAGVQLVVFGRRLKPILVPEEHRFRDSILSDVLAATAKAAGGQYALLHDGSVAVIYMEAAKDDLERIRKLLDSREVAERRQGVWLAGWTEDIRLLPAVVAAADDEEAGVRELAMQAVRRWGWPGVAPVEPAALKLLERDLANLNPDISLAAVRSVAELGSAKAEPALDEALGSRNARYRWNAGWAFWQFRKPEAMPFLQRVLRTGSGRLNSCIAEALGKTGCQEALPVIETAAADKDPEVRTAALRALANIPGERAEQMIWRHLAAKDAASRGGAVAAWARSKGADALPVIEKALRDNAMEVRREAARHAGCVRGDKALQLARAALDDPAAEVRGAALEALGDIGGPTAAEVLSKVDTKDDDALRHLTHALQFSPQKSRLQLLEDCLSNADYGTAYSAANALSQFDSEQTVAVVRRQLTLDKRPRWNHCDMLLRTMPRGTAFALLKELLRDDRQQVRARACHALAWLGGESALQPLGKAAEDQEVEVRKAACGALGNLGGPGALAILSRILTADVSSEVRSEAALVLGRISLPEAWKLIGERLADNDDQVRAGALFAMAAYGQVGVREAMERAFGDKHHEGRTAAAYAFVERWPAEAAEKVGPLLDDPDTLVRQSVASQLRHVIDDKIPGLLAKRLAVEKDAKVRRHILRSLGSFLYHPVVKKLLTEVSKEDADLIRGE